MFAQARVAGGAVLFVAVALLLSGWSTALACTFEALEAQVETVTSTLGPVLTTGGLALLVDVATRGDGFADLAGRAVLRACLREDMRWVAVSMVGVYPGGRKR